MHNIKRKSNVTIIGVALFVLAVNYLGFLQPLEFTIYDFLFLSRTAEEANKKIIIVTREEHDVAQETVISDKNLVVLLEKIRSQNPRVIGLDLYREKQVKSPDLKPVENDFYFQRLQQIFKETQSLVGIEKVVPPKVPPNPTLKKEARSGASDLPSDNDSRIRRSFIYPLENEKGDPAGTPYVGVLIAYKYLLEDGFAADKVGKNTLRFFNDEKDLEGKIKPLERFSGGYLKKVQGTSFLVNWRKEKFTRISTTDILSNQISPELLKDKIILIGETAISTSDRHYLYQNRWDRIQPSWTYGVDVLAQIVTHIIDNATEKRRGIIFIPEWIEILLIIVSILIIDLAARSKSQERFPKLVNISFSIAFLTIFALLLLAYIGIINGFWIPVAPSIIACLLSPVIINNSLHIDKIKANNKNIKRLFSDINHSLANPISSLLSKIELSEYILKLLENKEQNEEKIELLEKRLGTTVYENLQRNMTDCLILLKKINRIRSNSRTYFGTVFLGQDVFTVKNFDFNKLVSDTVKNCFELKEIEYDLIVKIETNLDTKITSLAVDYQSIERVIENLIDNAFYAIKEKINTLKHHEGKIVINSIKKKNEILLEIVDNGIGLPKEKLEVIFLPFRSFRAKNKGHGFGLPLAKETMKFHGGTIKVESVEWTYTKFTLIFRSRS